MSAIDVLYDGQHVGRLAEGRGVHFFEYAADFLAGGCELSPLKLPRRPGVMRFTADDAPPEGLPGLIADALPDAWGRKVIDAALARRRIAPTPLTRLAYLGHRTMGALSFRPALDVRGASTLAQTSLLGLERAAVRLAATSRPMEASRALAALLNVGASAGGMEPKVLVAYAPANERVCADRPKLPRSQEHWLVKFAPERRPQAKRVEHAFAGLARAAGIEFPETQIFVTRDPNGERAHFGVRRFDRDGNRRVHMHTAAGLLHRHPAAMDYTGLLAAAKHLTQHHETVLALLQRLVFCLLTDVGDDHGRNHAFLFDGASWRLAPAYDYVPGGTGERGMSVCGEAHAPGRKHVIELATRHDPAARDVDACEEKVRHALAHWPKIATEAGIDEREISTITASFVLAAKRYRRRR